MSTLKTTVGKPSERGIALISALLALMLLTLLGMALTGSSMLTLSIMSNERQSTEAFYLAESGLEHAKGLILTQTPADLDVFLTAGNATACDGDELSTAMTPFVAGDTITSIAAGGHLVAPTGRYEVVVCDDHLTESTAPSSPPNLPDNNANHDANGRILIRSTGFGRDGSRAALELNITAVPLPGLLVNGNLRINGNPSVIGAGGGVHANGTLDFDGIACAEQYFSASGAIVDSSNARTGTCPAGSDTPADVTQGAAVIPVPDLSPLSYRTQADYILSSDGRVRNQAGAILGTNNWNDWSWDSGNRRWVAGDNIPAGTYYAGNHTGAATPLVSINISGNPGEGGPPRALSLITTGYIDISGNPVMTPDLMSGSTGISMIAGTDLRMSGNPSNAYSGLHYARHQIALNGNPSINGQVMALNEADTATNGTNMVQLSSGFIENSGNPTINFNGVGGMVSSSVTSWRECRGANPATPCL